MNKDKAIELIAKHDVFSQFTIEELQPLKSILDFIEYGEGEMVYDTSMSPRFLYYIQEGSFMLHLPNNEYKKLEPGQLIGEIGLLNGDFRSGTIKAAEASKVISICGTRLFLEEFVPAVVALKIVRKLSKRITNYLRKSQHISTREIIRLGESDSVEFKASLRWNESRKQKDRSIELGIIKTLAGFINTNGGQLFVGVKDDGKILGIREDQFKNKDKLLLHMTGLIKDRIGAIHLRSFHITIENIEDKDILRIDCFPAAIPAYVKDRAQEYFFIRTGPSTTNLPASKIHEYIIQRF